MMSLSLLKLLHYADNNAMYSLDKNANIEQIDLDMIFMIT